MPYTSAIKEMEYQRQWRLANKDRINAKRREWRQNHREQVNASRRRWRARHPEVARYHEQKYLEWIRAIWGYSALLPQREIYHRAELHALKILPLYSFTDIVHFDYDPGFTFDFLANLNDKSCFIDVTTAARRSIGKKLRLSRLLGFPFFVLFISPNLKFHYLQNLTESPNNWAHIPSSVLRKFMEAKE